MTAVIMKLEKAALKTPEIIGIFVFSEIASRALLISFEVKRVGAVSILPEAFTKRFLPGPGHSTLRTAGFCKIGRTFCKPRDWVS